MRTRGFPVMVDVSGTRIDAEFRAPSTEKPVLIALQLRDRGWEPYKVSSRRGVGRVRPGLDERQWPGGRFNIDCRARITVELLGHCVRPGRMRPFRGGKPHTKHAPAELSIQWRATGDGTAFSAMAPSGRPKSARPLDRAHAKDLVQQSRGARDWQGS
jgi:hypothetical protein